MSHVEQGPMITIIKTFPEILRYSSILRAGVDLHSRLPTK